MTKLHQPAQTVTGIKHLWTSHVRYMTVLSKSETSEHQKRQQKQKTKTQQH